MALETSCRSTLLTISNEFSVAMGIYSLLRLRSRCTFLKPRTLTLFLSCFQNRPWCGDGCEEKSLRGRTQILAVFQLCSRTSRGCYTRCSPHESHHVFAFKHSAIPCLQLTPPIRSCSRRTHFLTVAWGPPCWQVDARFSTCMPRSRCCRCSARSFTVRSSRSASPSRLLRWQSPLSDRWLAGLRKPSAESGSSCPRCLPWSFLRRLLQLREA